MSPWRTAPAAGYTGMMLGIPVLSLDPHNPYVPPPGRQAAKDRWQEKQEARADDFERHLLQFATSVLSADELEKGEHLRTDTNDSILSLAARAGGMVLKDDELLLKLPEYVIESGQAQAPTADELTRDEIFEAILDLVAEDD
jgi:hypothetical protein